MMVNSGSNTCAIRRPVHVSRIRHLGSGPGCAKEAGAVDLEEAEPEAGCVGLAPGLAFVLGFCWTLVRAGAGDSKIVLNARF